MIHRKSITAQIKRQRRYYRYIYGQKKTHHTVHCAALDSNIIPQLISDTPLIRFADMHTPESTPTSFVSKPFDYLIIGGGTAGLVVANRLSADPDVRVGVIEAGPVSVDGDEINNPGRFGETLGTDIDWKLQTVPQAGLLGRRVPCARGKLLGGSSALNFMTWNRPSRNDLDEWCNGLGNKGWSWDDVLSVKRGLQHPCMGFYLGYGHYLLSAGHTSRKAKTSQSLILVSETSTNYSMMRHLLVLAVPCLSAITDTILRPTNIGTPPSTP